MGLPGQVQIAVRWKQKNGQWEYAVVIATLTAKQVIAETGQPLDGVLDYLAIPLAYIHCYDDRGG